jgi:hypothetical protein
MGKAGFCRESLCLIGKIKPIITNITPVTRQHYSVQEPSSFPGEPMLCITNAEADLLLEKKSEIGMKSANLSSEASHLAICSLRFPI